MTELMNLQASVEEAIRIEQNLHDHIKRLGLKSRPMSPAPVNGTVASCMSSLARLATQIERLRHQISVHTARQYRQLEADRLMKRIRSMELPETHPENDARMLTALIVYLYRKMMPNTPGKQFAEDTAQWSSEDMHDYLQDREIRLTKEERVEYADALRVHLEEGGFKFLLFKDLVMESHYLYEVVRAIVGHKWSGSFLNYYSKNLCPGFGGTTAVAKLKATN